MINFRKVTIIEILKFKIKWFINMVNGLFNR
nr:MAG TPA: hypothetical protein [Caudoviricetes sp.]